MAISQTHMAFAFGMLGNIISFMVFLAPVPTFYRIYKKKSTEGFQSLPYVVAMFSSMLWLYYAMLKTDAVLLITINSFGCVIETIYIAMFIAYASKQPRNSAIKLLLGMVVGLFAVILTVTHFAFSGVIRVQVMGWICVTFSVCVFAAPLSIVAQVIKTKSVEFMPLNLSLFLTASAVMWFAYGLFLKDICIALPNVLGFGLGLIQIILYGIYRKGNKKQQKKIMEAALVLTEEKTIKTEETLKKNNNSNVIVLTPITTSAEVYPADAQSYIVNIEEGQEEKKEEAMAVSVDAATALPAIECAV